MPINTPVSNNDGDVSSKVEDLLSISPEETQNKIESAKCTDQDDSVSYPSASYELSKPSFDAPFIDPTLDTYETEKDFLERYKSFQKHKFSFDISRFIYIHPNLKDRGLPLIVINAYEMGEHGIDKKQYQEEAVIKFILLLGSLDAMNIDGTWKLKYSVALLAPRGVKPSTTILRNARSIMPRTYRKAVTRLYISYNHDFSLVFTKILKIFSPKFAKKIVTIKLQKHEMTEYIFLRRALPINENK